MVETVIRRSNNKDKKFEARIDDRKTVLFGAKGYDHFTEGHLDDKRRQSYVARHGGGNQYWKDYETAGFWSYHLLWRKPTYKEAINTFERKLPKLRITMNK